MGSEKGRANFFTFHSELRIIENNSHDIVRRPPLVGRINTMKELETQERATLLLKVQRALDAKGIGRESLRNGWCKTLDIGDGLTFCQDSDAPSALRVSLSAFPYTHIATFTFAELFPELEWGRCAHGAQGVRVGTIHFGILGDDSECLMVSDPHCTVFIPLGTPKRAKRAAQLFADLLAEAGRDEA
jgi:hypothetical protein